MSIVKDLVPVAAIAALGYIGIQYMKGQLPKLPKLPKLPGFEVGSTDYIGPDWNNPEVAQQYRDDTEPNRYGMGKPVYVGWNPKGQDFYQYHHGPAVIPVGPSGYDPVTKQKVSGRYGGKHSIVPGYSLTGTRKRYERRSSSSYHGLSGDTRKGVGASDGSLGIARELKSV